MKTRMREAEDSGALVGKTNSALNGLKTLVTDAGKAKSNLTMLLKLAIKQSMLLLTQLESGQLIVVLQSLFSQALLLLTEVDSYAEQMLNEWLRG